MIYTCPACGMGALQPRRTTYLRSWGSKMITVPNFASWRCDSCGYTRYDTDALARLELVLGPDDESLTPSRRRRTGALHGPGETGPHRWSV